MCSKVFVLEMNFINLVRTPKGNGIKSTRNAIISKTNSANTPCINKLILGKQRRFTLFLERICHVSLPLYLNKMWKSYPFYEHYMVQQVALE
jgi:hypothetical protein